MSNLSDTGERMIPTSDKEISFVFERHRFAYRYISRFIKNCSVVDVGCGTGYGCKILSVNARFVLGIDYDSGALNYCKKNFSSQNIYFTQMNAEFLGLKPIFDAAVSFQVIEHIANPCDFIEELKKTVKTNGRIFITTPNVPKVKQSKQRNPYHQNEFDYNQFTDLISRTFLSFDIVGIVYKSQNLGRSIIQKLPFYRWGVIFKRNSKVKKLANHLLNMTEFQVTDADLDKSMDLLAVCKNL